MPIPREMWLNGKVIPMAYSSTIFQEVVVIASRYVRRKWFIIAGQVEELLKSNRDKAFTFSEIYHILALKNKFENLQLSVNLILLRLALEELISDDLVEARYIIKKDGMREIYYAWKSEND